MTEHIRKQAVLNLIDELQYNHETNTWGVTKDGVIVLKPDTLDKLHEAVKATPAADVVEVVRCKDCKHKMTDETLMALAKNKDTALFCERMGGVISEMFYCGAGERMDGEDL